MPVAFRGEGQVLDADGVAAACDTLRLHAAELWSVLTVETRGCGYLADRRPLILFERHYFSRLTKRKFDAKAPDISNLQWGGYVGGRPRIRPPLPRDQARPRGGASQRVLGARPGHG